MQSFELIILVSLFAIMYFFADKDIENMLSENYKDKTKTRNVLLIVSSIIVPLIFIFNLFT